MSTFTKLSDIEEHFLRQYSEDDIKKFLQENDMKSLSIEDFNARCDEYFTEPRTPTPQYRKYCKNVTYCRSL